MYKAFYGVRKPEINEKEFISMLPEIEECYYNFLSGGVGDYYRTMAIEGGIAYLHINWHTYMGECGGDACMVNDEIFFTRLTARILAELKNRIENAEKELSDLKGNLFKRIEKAEKA